MRGVPRILGPFKINFLARIILNIFKLVAFKRYIWGILKIQHFSTKNEVHAKNLNFDHFVKILYFTQKEI